MKYKVYYWINNDWVFSNEFSDFCSTERHANCFKNVYHTLIYDCVNKKIILELLKDSNITWLDVNILNFNPGE